MKIYIVEGSTGEYADRQNWLVKAYSSRDKADAHAQSAEKWINDYGVSEWRKQKYDANRDLNPYDPNMSVDYTGTSYYVIELDLD